MIQILLMDDDNKILKELEKVFIIDGYDVTKAQTSMDAKSILMNNQISVAILDINLKPKVEIEKEKEEQAAAGMEPFVPEEGEGFRVAAWIRSRIPQNGYYHTHIRAN